MGEAINVGERRPLLVDGANPLAGAIVSPNPSGLVTVDAPDVDGVVVVTAIAAGTLDITVDQAGRQGTDSGITITAVPLVVTLGDPIP
jgi:hypothetical protein